MYACGKKPRGPVLRDAEQYFQTMEQSQGLLRVCGQRIMGGHVRFVQRNDVATNVYMVIGN